MPSRSDLELWRKSLAEIEHNIELLQEQYDKTPKREAVNGISPFHTKSSQLADMIYEQKIMKIDVENWIAILEQELSNEM